MLFGLPAGELIMLVAALVVAGLVAGFLAGLLGIGGGGVLVPVLYEVFRILDVDPAIRMHMVLGTTLAIIAPTSLKSFAAHRARGSVDLVLLKRVAPWVVLGVVIGILTAKASSGTFLKWVWVISAGLVALKMALGREDWRLGDELPPRPWPEIAGGAVGFISTLMSIGGATFVVKISAISRESADTHGCWAIRASRRPSVTRRSWHSRPLSLACCSWCRQPIGSSCDCRGCARSSNS